MSNSKFDLFAREATIHPPASSLSDDEVIYVEDCNRTLPVEILTQIFELLPTDARKQVRRTCKYWHEVCSSPRITKTEKLVFQEKAPFTAMLDILRCPRFPTIDLVMHRHNFGLVQWQLWANFGRKITCIELRCCDFSSECIKNLIRYCPMLNRLSVHDIGHIKIKEDVFENELDPTDSYLSENGTIIQNFLAVVDDLYASGIRNCNLRTLTLSSNYSVENLSVVKTIFKVFPNVSNLHLGTWWCWNSTGRMMNENRIAQMESISSFPCNESAWIDTMSVFTRMRNLRHFETWVPSTGSIDSVDRVLLNFLQTLEHLEVVKIFFPLPKTIIVEELLFTVLPRLNNLRDIQIEAEVNLTVSQERVTQFMTLLSRVTRFSSTFTLRSKVNLPPPLTGKVSLESLCLKVPAKYEAIALYILGHCFKLKNLKLIDPTNGILQKVFGFMLNLRSLCLYNTESCTISAFTGDGTGMPGFSMKNLKKLEQLRIYFGTIEGNKGPKHQRPLMWSIVEEIEFRRLRLLELDTELEDQISPELEDQISPSQLRLLGQNVPNLEALILPNQPLGNLEETMAILRNWSYLKYSRLGCGLTSDFQILQNELPSVKIMSSNSIISRRDAVENNLLSCSRFEDRLLGFSDETETGLFEPSDLRYTL